MTTYRFELDFAGGDVSKGELPGAMAQIRLENWLVADDGRIFVSNQCITADELAGQVELLKSELDEIARKGGAKFAAYDAGTISRL